MALQASPHGPASMVLATAAHRPHSESGTISESCSQQCLCMAQTQNPRAGQAVSGDAGTTEETQGQQQAPVAAAAGCPRPTGWRRWRPQGRPAPALGARRPKPRSRRGPASPKALRKDPSLPLLAFTGCQESAASLVCKGITSICLHHPCHPPYTCLSGCKFPSSPKDTSHWTGTHLTLV